MSREAMQMALEALESDPLSHAGLVSRKQAIAALRQALETEQEPVAWASSLDFDDDDQEIIPAKDKGKLGTSNCDIPLYTSPKHDYVIDCPRCGHCCPPQSEPVDREEIIRMAREAGLAYGTDEKPLNSVTRFAALVAAHEREACAKVCDVLAVHPEYASDITKVAAQAIRARGEK